MKKVIKVDHKDIQFPEASITAHWAILYSEPKKKWWQFWKRSKIIALIDLQKD